MTRGSASRHERSRRRVAASRYARAARPSGSIFPSIVGASRISFTVVIRSSPTSVASTARSPSRSAAASARSASARASDARASQTNRHRQEAEHGRERRHHDRAQSHDSRLGRGVDRALAFASQSPSKLDEQHRVRHRDPDGEEHRSPSAPTGTAARTRAGARNDRNCATRRRYTSATTHGHTAAEIVHERADGEKPLMGM